MAWAAPEIITTRGRQVRHTRITIVGTLNGTTTVVYDFGSDVVPVGIFAGSLAARSDGGTATDKTTISLRCGSTTIGNTVEFNLYQQQLTLDADPDYFEFRSVFEQVGAPTAANFMGAMTLPVNELRLNAVSDNASQTSETVTVYIGLLSYVLEV